MTDKVKAKRKLTNIDFQKEGSHLALVHKVQGGGANNYTTLVMKATDKYTPEFIQKASQVKVTLSLPDFLEKFFHVWGEDADVLAAMFGYEPSEDNEDEYSTQSFWSWYREQAMEHGAVDSWGDPLTRPTSEDKMQWVQEQLKGIEILKSATLSKGSADFISNLTEEQYLALLKDQEFIEKSFIKKDESTKETIDLSKSKSGGEPKPSKANTADTQENKMTQETIAKAQADMAAKEVELQKALADIKKAQEEVELYKAKEKVELQKARKADLLGAIEIEDEAEKLFKAVGELSVEQFNTVVEVVKALNAKVDNSGFFKETGTQQGEQVQKSSLQDMINNKYKKA